MGIPWVSKGHIERSEAFILWVLLSIAQHSNGAIFVMNADTGYK